MRKLAYDSCQVPPRYQVKPGALSVEPDAIATGGYADIRRGILDGQIVAVKTLRFRERADANDIQKVGIAADLLHGVYLQTWYPI